MRKIAIVSGKGGVGKTLVALNLTTALKEFGRDVILVDGDLRNANIGVYLGALNLPFTLHDALKYKKHITEIVYRHGSGLKIIPGSISFENSVEVEPDRLKEVIDGLEGKCEAVIIDSPAGISEESLAAIDAADELILVTNPEMPAVTDALKTIKFAEAAGKNVIGIILNRVENQRHEIHASHIQSILGKPIIASIPEDHHMKRSAHLKHPVVYSHPNSHVAALFKDLAAKLIGQEYKSRLTKEDIKKVFANFG